MIIPQICHIFDYRTFPHLVRIFKRNLFKEYREYWSKSLNKDKFDSSVGNKLSLFSEVKNGVRFESGWGVCVCVCVCEGGGGTPLQEANRDVPLDGVWVTRMGSHFQ